MSHLDEDRMTALLDGELPALEARKAREHIAECAECSARFDEVKSFFGEADRLVQVLAFPQAPAPALVPAPPAPAAPIPRKHLPIRQLAWAASVVLALGLGYYGNQLERTEAPSQIASQKTAQPAVTPPSEGRALADEKAANKPESALGNAAPTSSPKPAPATAAPSLPAAPPVNERQAQTTGRLDALASKDEPARAKRNESQPPAQVAGAAAPGNPLIPRDAVVTKQSVAGELDKSAAAGGAGKSVDAQSDSGSATLRRERSEAEARSLAARSDLQKEMAPAAATASGFRAATIPPPVKVSMEQAIQVLGGTIHLIDGMSPDRVEQLTARAVLGAHAGLPVIRVIYIDPPMREIWLDQQRGLGASAPRDTVWQWTPDGGQNMQWMTGTDDWLSLTAHLTADSVRTLAQWVR